MKVKDLVEKLGEFLPDLEVCYEEIIDRISILEQDFEFRMDKFSDPDTPKPYYKLIISAKKRNGRTNWDNFKDVNPEEDL